MTIKEAIIAEITPYTVPDNLIEKVCTDNLLTSTDTYLVTVKTSVARCAIAVLQALISLTSDSEGGFSQGYDVKALERRISAIASDNRITNVGTQPKIRNASYRW